MSVFHENMLIGASGQVAAGGISRSLRFNSADSAYLSRTPASAGNRKTWTWAGWVKRAALGGGQNIFGATRAASTRPNCDLFFSSSDNIEALQFNGSGYDFRLITNAVFRDTSAWYHIVFAIDTTQGTSANRAKLYVNGVEQSLSTASYPGPSADLEVNNNVIHNIGRLAFNSSDYFNGYLADIYFIDGQALTPSSFTEVSATTGQLIPKAYTGTFTGNSFWLKFADNSAATATTLGKDSSGLGNNWTPNNLSVTAGAGNDSLVDTPTSYGTDTGVGGEVRGNYCTWNPLKKSGTAAGWTAVNGNLDLTWSNGNDPQVWGTIGFSAGKWYWEVTAGSIVSNSWLEIVSESGTIYAYQANTGDKYNGATAAQSAYGATWTTGDVIGVAVDADNGSIVMYKNGVSQGTMFSGLTLNNKSWFPGVHVNAAATATAWSANFGQRPFAYTAPSGFKALVDTNLPAPVVAKSSSAFDVVLYTGNGSSSRSITGLQFSPDFIWGKERNSANWHNLVDIVRGASKRLYSNSTIAEEDVPTSFISFDSGGFTIGNDNATNENNAPYVAWTWDAGSSTVTNTQGSITSSVRANATAGFSIVTYTGTGSNATVGHGLGVAPFMFIVKNRGTSSDWDVYHGSLATPATSRLVLQSTAAVNTGTSAWNSTNPTSTVVSLGVSTSANANGNTHVMYCFAPVAGYSSFGSYTGNGANDGPFIYLGFRPKWIMIKAATDTTYAPYNGWLMIDAARYSYNGLGGASLFANASYQEGTGGTGTTNPLVWLDILSNGFKIRRGETELNFNGTYIYAAFAESPFQFSRAR